MWPAGTGATRHNESVSLLLADWLASARRREFVGRDRELAMLRSLLAAENPGAVIYLYGLGGVGKTSLLRHLAWEAEQDGRAVVWIDGHDLQATAEAMLAHVARARGVSLATVLEGWGRTLLVIDAMQRLGALDAWLRQDFLPRLPEHVLVVLVGREPPSVRWRADPGWRAVIRHIELDNLDPHDSRSLLQALGVPGSEHARALAVTHGHPLALALVGELVMRSGGRFTVNATGEALAALVTNLVDAVPTAMHRAALEACAQVLVTTEPLLAALVGVPDAGELFDWLRSLSIMEYATRGIYPRDVARQALGAEFRWRHPDRYREVHRRARAYYLARFTTADPAHQQSLLLDYAYLHRDSPVLGPMLRHLSPEDTDQAGGSVAPIDQRDWPVLRAMLAGHEGEESARIAEHWLARQPEGVHAVYGADGTPSGLFVLVALERTDLVDRDTDPAVAAACRHLDDTAPLRDTERATLVRFWLDRDAYQDPSTSQVMITIHTVRHCLTMPRLAVHLVPYRDADQWAAACDYANLRRVPAADFEVGGHRYAVYGHDWRATPPMAWLDLLAERETAQAPLAVAPAQRAPQIRVLERAEFVEAVRLALRDLVRADRLATSALTQSRLVVGQLTRTTTGDTGGQGTGGQGTSGQGTSGGGASGDGKSAGRAATAAAVIERELRAAAAILESSDRARYRVIHHTFLQPAGTQQRAAELLDLPTSTYRRYLAAGIEALAEILWQRELHA